ncbi:galactosamine-6-phosphate isomerase [Citrobacter farmeri]|uniref:galactosamine-6-phosphate isomerase n=1 Tax=Citrobacter farmeri TaxID=67824 RepID=UPI00189984CE|nr:galactosamine-6-phosphate isomerase [Citrobacter farmeri]MBJ9136828.1 galactosamine-6-phosphate isomerase [Citrobacter farmeri]MDB2168636.1 galactosamine-6-phosphate isomerase [Citrobacter farmeri]HED3139185.1 galactosamine-6-phosphate isomerase [Citrobacter farmeri]
MQCIQYCDHYDALSDRASERLIQVIQDKPDATICLATGATPELTYRFFVEKIQQRHVDIRNVSFVKLDEWVGIPLHTPGTCESFLQQHIMQPLGLRPEQLIGFQSENIDEAECERVTDLIASRGGLDLCVLGIGKNGHLGLNEPGSALEPFCHISRLDEQTRHHDMLKSAGRPVTHGITLGLKEILNAKEILLLIAGEGKQDVVDKYLTTAVTTAIPASFLWLHDNTTYLLDGSRYSDR